MADIDGGASGERSSSLSDTFNAVVTAISSAVHTRLELFVAELEEERDRLTQLLILTAAAVFCLMFGALLATLLVVALFWETDYRLYVLGGLALIYLIAGGVMVAITRKKTLNRPKLFAATLGELAKDYDHLSS